MAAFDISAELAQKIMRAAADQHQSVETYLSGLLGDATSTSSPADSPESEDEIRFHAVVEAMAEGVVVQDAKGEIITCNPRAEAILGLTVNQMMGRTSLDPLWRAIHEDGSDFPGETHPAVVSLQTGQPQSDVIMGVHKPDGSLQWVSVNSQPLFRKNVDSPYAVVITFTDITRLKTVEADLNRDKAHLDRLMEISPVGIITTDHKGRITYANAQAEDILGLSRSSIIDRHYNDPKWRITDFDGQPFPDEDLPFSRVMATQQAVYGIRHAIEWPNGSRVLLSVNAAPMFNAKGEFEGMVAETDDVTERYHTSRALQASEEKFRHIVDNSLQGIAVFLDGRLVFVNPAMVTMTGYSVDELTAMSAEQVGELIHPDDRERVLSNARKRMAGLSFDTHYTFQILHKDGQSRTLETFETLTNYQSKPAIQAAFIDITERRLVEEELRQYREDLEALVEERTKQLSANEMRHRLIAETITDYVYSASIGADNKIYTHWFEGAFEKITGYTLETLRNIEDGWAKLIHPDDHDLLFSVGKLLRERGSVVIQYRIFTASGEIRWLQDYARVTDIDIEADVHHLVGAVQDITEMKQIEEALDIEKHQSEVILQHIADAILLTDVNANILYANPAWERITGFSAAEAKGKNTTILHSGRTPQSTYDDLWQTLFSNESWTGLFFNKRKDGIEYDALSTITPVKNSQGEIMQFVQIHRDITEERQLAAMREAFVANAAHDLKNPIAVLRNTLFLLKHDTGQMDRWIEVFESQIDLLRSLVDDLLILSRLDRHELPLDRQPTDFNTLVEKLIDGQRVLAAEKGLSLTFIPPEEPCVVYADTDMFQRVIVNLVDNAVNYTPTGGRVTVKITLEAAYAVFTVEDTGIGIGVRDLQHIFDRFYRSESARKTTNGTGLGLAIVKEVVELHDGRIDVSSTPQDGTRIRIYLPMAVDAVA
jgi:PAS domain S-box-containing protein